MKKLPAILGLLLLICIFFPGCEVENCPPNSMSYAYFSLVDQHGRSFNTSDTITIVGQTHADIVVYDTLPDGSLQSLTQHWSSIQLHDELSREQTLMHKK